MRPFERIEPFMDKVDLKDLFQNIWKIYVDQLIIDLIVEKREELINLWNKNPDWRFSQLLVNSGIVPNIPGIWYYMEESEILERQGNPPEDVNYWGVYFDKDMNLLESPVYKAISALESEHLKAIVYGGFVERNPIYKAFMTKVLTDRGDL